MKVVILAGGLGSRLAEETKNKPKPMVEIGGHPILWHIMKYYAHSGYDDFVIVLGYKGEVIKKYMIESNLDWKVELIDTGMKTPTGGRIRRLQPYLGDQTFMLTWGDGLSNVDLGQLLAFHRFHGKLATLTAVRPPARFGHLELDGNQITTFSEKPKSEERWINGAFFVLESGIFDYIKDENMMWEQEPLENLAKDGQLMAYFHEGFWQCMDTVREKQILEEMWNRGKSPWKIW